MITLSGFYCSSISIKSNFVSFSENEYCKIVLYCILGRKIKEDGISKKPEETESKIVRAQSRVIKGGPRVKRNITEQEVMEQVKIRVCLYVCVRERERLRASVCVSFPN